MGSARAPRLWGPKGPASCEGSCVRVTSYRDRLNDAVPLAPLGQRSEDVGVSFATEESPYLSPEARARVEIDRMLTDGGWSVQAAKAVNLSASRGVAVREFVMRPPHGRADYLLFLDGRAAGVVEAKKEGETLTGVEHQSAKYVDGLPDELEPAVDGGLAFVYESTGTETRFTNRIDPDPASRPIFSFHRPETLIGWLDEIRRHPTAPTLRHRLRALPELQETRLWPASPASASRRSSVSILRGTWTTSRRARVRRYGRHCVSPR